MKPGARFVGQRVARHEDARFLTGRGQFVDDIDVPGALHVAFARSHTARGRIVSIDTKAAAEVPGVVAVYVASDLGHLVQDHRVDDEPPQRERPFRLLADGDVRYVGEPVAMIVAGSRYHAEDAVDAIEMEIDAEDPLLEPTRARDADVPRVHPEEASNVYVDVPYAPNPALDEVLASAPVVLTETFRQHRYATVPMETRGILASWDRVREELTVWISTQGPHGVRGQMARVLGIEDSQVHVIMPDVGGAFGLKMHPRPEELAVVLAAKLLGRPVKWIQDRRENLMADEHARHDHATVTMAADEDGTLLGAKVEFLEVAGSFPSPGGSAAVFTTILFPGPYRIPAFGASALSVHTNTVGRGAYRGPWMVETVAREQMIDCLAARLEIDPLELRRRNVIRDEELPYVMPTGMVYDQMTAAATLEQAAEKIGYEQLREQQRAWRADGRLVGIGVSMFAEPTAMAFGFMSTDAATVRVSPNGKVDVAHTGASHGQGVETTIAQVVADELGVDFDQVRVIQGDTDKTPFGPGTGGSRSAVILGGAARLAAREVRDRMFSIVAHQLEAAEHDLELVNGRVQVAGTPNKGMTITEIAHQAYSQPASLPEGVPPGLEAQVRYTPDSFCTWSNACHICVCEVDPATGAVEILRYVVSEDCGVMINPNVVEGQIAGGVVQGIGGVLYEHLPYDDAGNPLATTFVDYLLPTATEVPEIEYGHIETPAPTNPGGHKGLGEGGAIGAPPAVINAIADALAPLGVQVRDQPLGPADIVALIEEAGA
ncbi:MAG TPA: xanthine dehydrogenase family protein molybdopterin-binding subunit [Acidimicrobiia bacterium]|nr:xanthine dehydrogenase family protein molybdopterin-binding subunit [Acidimicrobiia bacterium]